MKQSKKLTREVLLKQGAVLLVAAGLVGGLGYIIQQLHLASDTTLANTDTSSAYSVIRLGEAEPPDAPANLNPTPPSGDRNPNDGQEALPPSGDASRPPSSLSSLLPIHTPEISAGRPSNPPVQTTPAPPPALTIPNHPEPGACVRKILGVDRANQLTSGQIPTSDEVAKVASCFNLPVTGANTNTSNNNFAPVSVPSSDFLNKAEPAVHDCVVKVGGADLAHQIFDLGTAPSGAFDTVKSCFPPSGSIRGTTAAISQLPDADITTCLKGKGVDSQALKDLSQGTRAAKPDELSKGQSCYEQQNATPFMLDAQKLPTNAPAITCAKAILGNLDQINTQTLTADQRSKVAACFTPTTPTLAPAAKPSLSTTAVSCLEDKIGKDRFAQIQSGQSVPTTSERSAGSVCFQTEDSNATSAPGKALAKVLPLSQAEALLRSVENDKTASEPKVTTGKAAGSDTVKVSGTINANVDSADVYLNSDTQIITVPVTNGTWTVEVPSATLDTNVQHTVYAVATIDNTLTRSPVVAFDLNASPSPSSVATATATATTSSVTPTPSHSPSPDTDSNTPLWELYAASAVLILICIIWLIVSRR